MPDTLAPLSVTSIAVTSPLGYNWRDVQLAIDDGVVTVATSSGLTLATKAGLVSWTHPNADSWVLTFDDADVWTVRKPGCGCGGRG